MAAIVSVSPPKFTEPIIASLKFSVFKITHKALSRVSTTKPVDFSVSNEYFEISSFIILSYKFILSLLKIE